MRQREGQQRGVRDGPCTGQGDEGGTHVGFFAVDWSDLRPSTTLTLRAFPDDSNWIRLQAPALRALKRLFLPLMARAPDAVVIMNAAADSYCQRPDRAWFGYTLLELHGHFLEILVPHRASTGPLSVSPLATGLAVTGRREDGQAFPVEMSLSALVLEDELFVVCLLRDAVARAEEDAAARRTELLVILGQLAATVSHEIRNPLQALTLHLQMLKDDLDAIGEIAASFVAVGAADSPARIVWWQIICP